MRRPGSRAAPVAAAASTRYGRRLLELGGICLTAALLLVTFRHASADFLNLTGAETAPNIAEITVLDDRVSVRLEIYVGDLGHFLDLIPDDMLKNGGASRAGESERMARFSRSGLTVRGPDGATLSAELKLVEPRLRIDRQSPYAGGINPYTRQRIPEPPADKRVLYAEIEYPFPGKPDTLRISPPMSEDGRALVSIGFIAYHKSVPIIDFRYLSTTATLHLDWDDPWYSRFENRNLKRHHKSALMSFLYVEPREVRHEVLIRVRDLQDWTDLALSADTTLDEDEQTEVKRRARRFFESRNPLSIDGAASKPVSSRAEFVRVSTRGLTVVEGAASLELSTALLGIILSYPVEHLPQSVHVRWELFNERIDRVPASTIDPAGPLASFVEPDSPTIEWQNFLRTYTEPTMTPVTIDARRSLGVPVVASVFVLGAVVGMVWAIRSGQRTRLVAGAASLVLVVGAVLAFDTYVVRVPVPGFGPPDDGVARQIVKATLDNVHVAYLENQEPRLAKALSMVVTEQGREDVRAELDRALAIRVAGGGTARVRAVEDLVVEDVAAMDGTPGFRSLAEWTAHATAGHWGHQHVRRIRFRALMELEKTGGVWKIAGITVIDAQAAS